MPYQNQVSHSPVPNLYVSHTRQRATEGFDKVDVANGSLPPTSGTARSPQSNGQPAGFPLRHGASIESLNNLFESGQLDDPSGFGSGLGIGDGDGGDGLHRADYPKQIERSHPLDLGRQSLRYQGQHGQDIAREISSLLQQWDQQAGAIDGRHAPKGATPPDALFSRTQIDESNMSREHCARTVLAGLGIKPDVVETLLRHHARSEGCTAILDACRLLTMPELVADQNAHAKLQKQLASYVRAARGEYSGAYEPFGHDSHKEIKKLKDGVEKTVAAIGYSVVKDRLLADLTPALVHALERKNPGMSSEALRARLPELINAQGFSALTHRMNNANASGLLQDAPLLPQFVESAEEPKPPPAGKPAEPVNDFVKHLVSVLGAIKPPNIHIENNAKQIVNQDDWNFQGNKDPRPEKTVEAAPPPLVVKVPEARDAESRPLVEDDVVVANAEVPLEQVEVDEQEVDVEDNPPPVPPPFPQRSQTASPDLEAWTKNFGRVLEELKQGVTLKKIEAETHEAPPAPVPGFDELHEVRDKLRKTQIRVHDAPPVQLQRTDSPVNDEDDDDAAEKTIGAFIGKSDRASFGRLAAPFEPGKQPSASLSVDVHERLR